MNRLTPLALVTAAALALAACGGGNNNGNREDSFTAQVRALIDNMSETIEASQATFDRLIATTPETTEPSPL